ncbi:MAG: aminoacyl-tRNA hydrolase [Candidatus Aenigmatarchaeota archaeon]
MIKQVIVIRNDLGMSLGKICAQACHASIGSFEKTPEDIKNRWKLGGQKKVILQVNSRKEIIELHKKAKSLKVPCFLVKDAGLTELKPGTITALGIGPEKEEKINKITGSLKLL